MLKRLYWMIAIALFGASLVLILNAPNHVHVAKPTVEVGQEWVFIYNEQNPFEETEIDTVCVLDVKDGHVQYVRTHTTRGFNETTIVINDTNSNDINTFVMVYDLVK